MKNEKTTVGGLGHSALLRTLLFGSLNKRMCARSRSPKFAPLTLRKLHIPSER